MQGIAAEARPPRVSRSRANLPTTCPAKLKSSTNPGTLSRTTKSKRTPTGANGFAPMAGFAVQARDALVVDCDTNDIDSGSASQ